MSKKLVIHIFHDDESSLSTAAHVSERIRQVMGQRDVALEVYVFGPAEKHSRRIVINTGTALLFMRGGEHDLNIRGAFLHMAADAIVSAGVLMVGALALWKGWNWLDPVVSLVIVVAILAGTLSLFRQSLHMLFDGVPFEVDPDAARQFGIATRCS